MSSRLKIRLAAAGVVCIGLGAGWYFSKDAGWRPAMPTAEKQRLNGPTPISGESSIPLKFVSADSGQSFALAMDEICVKGADGEETIVRLNPPPATARAFREKLRELSVNAEAFPIAYVEGQPRDEVSRRLITRQMRVKLPAGSEDRVAAANGLSVSERPDYAPEWVILEATDPLAALAAVDSVRMSKGVAEADVLTGRKRFTRAMPTDSSLLNNQWHLKNSITSPSITHANVESAWNYPAATGIRGNGIRIGIVDDGLQTAHPDLSPNVDTVNGRDWNGVTQPDYDPNPSATTDRHGTACAGVAGARGNNNIGVSGVAPEATLVGMRLISASPTDQQEGEAMAWKNDIIQVKSNSWGPYDRDRRLEAPEPLMAAALQNAAMNGRSGKGTILVWAGGNGADPAYEDNSNFDGYANSIYTIAVAALERSGQATDYSEPGANILITAPGGDRDSFGMVTTDRTGAAGYNTATSASGGDYYTGFDGTSAATPVVSGVAAMILQKNPELGWRDVQEILFRSATKVVPSDAGWKTNGAGFSFHHQFGGGLVNATAAVNMAETWVNLPAQTSLSSTDAGAVTIPNNNATGASKTFTFSQVNHRVEAVTVQLAAAHSARGNLAITLTSPSGTISRLTEVRTDNVANYSWKFSSVHNWGESAQGTWTLKVADLSSTGNTTGGTLNSVTLTLFGSTHVFPNTAPIVTSAWLDRNDRSFTDEPLQVASAYGEDPQGATVTFTYQWQSSTDGNNYTNAPGETAQALSISSGNAGKLWRCAVTPSNGTIVGDAYNTNSVNLLTRPPAFVKTGANFSYTPGLVILNQGSSSWFGLGAASASINGLEINGTTGEYSGTVATSAVRGIRNMIFQRYDSQGNVISFNVPLKVVAGSYAQWAGDYPLAKSEPPVDNDNDGIPNLVEYMMDLKANVTDTPSPVVFGQEGNVLTLTYRESKIPSDATLAPEWATSLGTGAGWQSTGIVTAVLEENETSWLKKASLTISPGDPKRFLRLKAAQVSP